MASKFTPRLVECAPGDHEHPPKPDARRLRWELRDTARQILGKEWRVSKCGHKIVGQQATLVMGDSGAYIGSVETCGSVWVCTICNNQIANGRQREVGRCLDAHEKTGGDVYMVTFTIPHKFAESCRELRGMVSGAWSKMIAGDPWKRLKERYGVVGSIRSLEVTHGANGWHPHLHTLFLTRALTDAEREAFEFALRDRWLAKLDKMFGKIGSTTHAVDFRKAENGKIAGEYVSKWGVDSEITKTASKRGRSGGRSPWQLLADAKAGDHFARMLFKEYAAAFFGARQLTWSLGLRDLYNIEPELSDYELAKRDSFQNGDTVIGVFHRGLWSRIVVAGLVPEILNAAECAGWSGVLKLLRERGLALPAGIPRNDD